MLVVGVVWYLPSCIYQCIRNTRSLPSVRNTQIFAVQCGKYNMCGVHTTLQEQGIGEGDLTQFS